MRQPGAHSPLLSVVVVVYNMAAQAKRTLISLGPEYQRGVEADDYEVLVIDNGSNPPFPTEEVRDLAPNIHFHCVDEARPSPARALNWGAHLARADRVGFIVDGARLVTPGILGYALKAFRAFDNPVCTAPAWHIGPDIHRRAIAKGYTHAREDELLKGIGWQQNGYNLFGISTLGGSSPLGWLGRQAESSTLFMRRDLFHTLGGYDERFDEPGGGLVNHEFFYRALSAPGISLVQLLGEGSFHQMHGGAMTGASEEEARRRLTRWHQQYQELTGQPLRPPPWAPHYIGHIPPQALEVIESSAKRLDGAASGQSTNPACVHHHPG